MSDLPKLLTVRNSGKTILVEYMNFDCYHDVEKGFCY